MRFLPYLIVVAVTLLVIWGLLSAFKRGPSPKSNNSQKTLPYGAFLSLVLVFVIVAGAVAFFILVFLFNTID